MRQDWRPLALVTQLGLTVAVSLVLSLLLGLWLDGQLGTKPIFTLVFSLIGILAGSVGVYRLITQAIGEVTGPERSSGKASQARGQRRRAEPESDDDREGESDDEDEDRSG